MLDVRNLEVRYGQIRAVQGISIQVNKGEIVALIGANGAGKSSIMHAICGIKRATLTIEENLRLGAYGVAGPRSEEQNIERVLSIFPMLKNRLSERGAALSGGQAQMLALARALMAQPKLLMLDEPSLGLAPVAVEEVYTLIEELRRTGVTILLVEQNVRQALAVANKGYIIESGQILLEGKAEYLANHELLLNTYMGLERGDES